MNSGLGIGGLFILALLWFILKPLLMVLLRGLFGLFGGKADK